MRLPALKSLTLGRDMTTTFRGLNRTEGCGDGEWADERNLSSDEYPCATTRKKRAHADKFLFENTEEIQGVTYNGGWVVAIDKTIVLLNDDGTIIRWIRNMDRVLVEGRKTLVNIGAYVYIFPDGYYVNTVKDDGYGNFEEHGSIIQSNNIDTTTHHVGFQLANIEIMDLYRGVSTARYYYEDTDPNTWAQSERPVLYKGDYWIKTPGGEPHIWNGEKWKGLKWDHMLISGDGIAEGLSIGEGVEFYFSIAHDGEYHIIPGEISEEMRNIITALDGKTFRIEDLYTATGQPDRMLINVQAAAGLTDLCFGRMRITRYGTNGEFVTECGNRLWGCLCSQINGKMVNEIYASSLGNGKSWHAFSGSSTDSYAVSVGDPGEFTGSVTFHGYPFFFKENCVYKIYGNMPENYQVIKMEIDGVAKGCGRSIQEIDGFLYYVSRRGVLRFDGSSPPVCISDALGDVKVFDCYDPQPSDYAIAVDARIDGAVSGKLFHKYYLAPVRMQQESDGISYMGKPDLYVFDTKRGLWHVEDGLEAVAMFSRMDRLYALTGRVQFNYGDLLPVIIGEDAVELATREGNDGKVKWYGVTGIFNTDDPDRVYVSRVNLRMQLSPGSRCMVYIRYDSFGDWKHVATVAGTSLRSYNLPVRVRRCDHFRLKLEGEGDVKIYGITRTTEEGSDLC